MNQRKFSLGTFACTMEGKEVDDRKDDRGEPKVEINLLSDIKDYRLPQVNINKSFEEMISDTPKLGKSTLGSFERLEIPQNPSEYKLVAASTSFFENFALDDKKFWITRKTLPFILPATNC